MRQLNREFLTFLGVGVLNTAVGVTITFLFLNAIGLNYWASTFLGNSVGAVISYTMNKTFTFKSKKSNREAVWRFAGAIIGCYFLSYWLSYMLFEQVIGDWIENEWIHKNLTALVGAGIYTLLNYVAQKYFVFKQS